MTLTSLSRPSAGIGDPRISAQLQDSSDAQKLIVFGSIGDCKDGTLRPKATTSATSWDRAKQRAVGSWPPLAAKITAASYDDSNNSYNDNDRTTYYFNNDQGTGPEPGGALLQARLMQIDHRVNARQITDLADFEAANDPDGSTAYGVRDAVPECLASAPYMQSLGELFSHPYSSAPANNGVYVGDAGANAVLFVNKRGNVKLVKAVPAEAIMIDATLVAVAAEAGMLGLKYYAQAVPTDIEVSGNTLADSGASLLTGASANPVVARRRLRQKTAVQHPPFAQAPSFSATGPRSNGK